MLEPCKEPAPLTTGMTNGDLLELYFEGATALSLCNKQLEKLREFYTRTE